LPKITSPTILHRTPPSEPSTRGVHGSPYRRVALSVTIIPTATVTALDSEAVDAGATPPSAPCGER